MKLKLILLSRTRKYFIDDVCFVYGTKYSLCLDRYSIFGRPSEIELLVLIDRRFSRNLPIQPDYRGRQVDAINNEKVKVEWSKITVKM
jgi:pyrimidine operon attenuation protein/uracil phosphoribosyltransferase